jgi:uncharacterized iron-regulated membrane protein
MLESSADERRRQRSHAVRAAAVMYLVMGIGFGVAAVVTLAVLARDGELPMTPWGFRSMSGPFDQLGPGPFTVLGWAFVGVCVLDVVTGIWLWQGRRRGAWLGLATTPFALGLGAGFALPFLLLGAPIRASLVIAGRQSLT